MKGSAHISDAITAGVTLSCDKRGQAELLLRYMTRKSRNLPHFTIGFASGFSLDICSMVFEVCSKDNFDSDAAMSLPYDSVSGSADLDPYLRFSACLSA
jgi:hypothetical protein